ncbi:ComEC/Rec2 family competence protein [Sphingobacterium sp.]|uniref:ComEC/Rec2 family competence protein n=1 Tax=Sphingobacterium sp. TaxID=341027 RepID=UPI00289D01BD|nr:ComEC/Rec2 family competence protein [Sphingobacterium sp.]
MSTFDFKLNVSKAPCIKALVPFCLGIAIAYFLPIEQVVVHYGFIYLAGLLPILFIVRNRVKSFVLSAYLFLCFLMFAIQLTVNCLPTLDEELRDSEHVWVALIDESPLERDKIYRMTLKLIGRQEDKEFKELNQKVLVQGLLWKDSSLSVSFGLGDTLLIRGKITETTPARNPYAFDYSAYLKSQAVQYQIWFTAKSFRTIAGNKENYLPLLIENNRQLLNDRFHQYIPEQSYAALASAITIGYRAELSAELMQTFSKTGTIHILSVSGMHVAIVCAVITFLLSPLRFVRRTRLLSIWISLACIWLFAVCCGLGPAVLRATLMFSLYLLSLSLRRDLIGLNSLAGSALILLSINPLMLLDMGFQLSYLAVFGIMTIMPILQRMYYSYKFGISQTLDLFYMSIAAQVSTTSLALFYFHQFPTYFLLGNFIMAIPSSIIMIGGIILMLCPFDVVNELVGIILQKTLGYSYIALQQVEALPFSSIQGFYWSWQEMILMHIILLGLLIAFRFKEKRLLWVSVLSLFLFIAYEFRKEVVLKSYEGLRFYQLGREFAIAMIERPAVYVYSSADSLSQKNLQFSIHNDLTRFSTLEEVIFVKLPKDSNRVILKEGVEMIAICNKACTTDAAFVLLRNNIALTNANTQSVIILDGSNSWSFINEKTTELDALGRRYYILKENFAYVWDI